jgi:phytoene synthase
MMTKIFPVLQNIAALKAAEHLGIAMQITNILRDIKEDFYKGRIYLPENICKYSNFNILESTFNSSNEILNQPIQAIEELSQRAIFYYSNAANGVKYINKYRYRLCVRLMTAIYSAILSRIIKNNSIVLQKRVVISFLEKIFITIKVILGFHPLVASGIKTIKINAEKKYYEKV